MKWMWSESFFILNVLIDVSIWHFEICESVLWDYKVFFLEEKSMMPESLHLYLCIWQVLLSKVSYIAFKHYIWTVNTLCVNHIHDLGIACIYSLSCMQECCLQLTTVILKRLCFFLSCVKPSIIIFHSWCLHLCSILSYSAVDPQLEFKNTFCAVWTSHWNEEVLLVQDHSWVMK